MLTIQNLSYIHPNKDLLFADLDLSIETGAHVALIGNNGIGKSTLMKLIAGVLKPNSGTIDYQTVPYYIPQIYGQFDHMTIAQALQVDQKLNAYHAILNGSISTNDYDLLDDDWTIEDRCMAALAKWQLSDLILSQRLDTLSGGQKTKVFLSGIEIHQPSFIMADEPTNDLDISGRKQLRELFLSDKHTVLIVSHDRALLQCMNTIFEWTRNGIKTYGGNYDFYVEQKKIEDQALIQDIQEKEKQIRKAREKERASIERQQKLDSRGKKKQTNSGVAKIMMNTLRNNAEQSTAKIKDTHSEKISSLRKSLQELRDTETSTESMKLGFEDANLHKGKILCKMTNVNFAHPGGNNLWSEPLNINIQSGERIAINGDNGSGKTTLIQLLLGNSKPTSGEVHIADFQSVYIDQDYSLIRDELSVYDQAQQFNTSGLEEHEVKIRLHRFLFDKDDWDKLCQVLSGGERMRLMLCCLNVSNHSPDIIVLDEPTNNLDIQNVSILTNAIEDFQGTLIVISHDETFLKSIGIERSIEL